MDNLNQCLFPHWQASQRKTSWQRCSQPYSCTWITWEHSRCCVLVLSHWQLFVIPWSAALQAPPSVDFSRQEHWSGQLVPSAGAQYIFMGWIVLPLVKRHFSKKHRWWGSGSYSQIEFLKIEMTLKSWLVRAFTMLWVNS